MKNIENHTLYTFSATEEKEKRGLYAKGCYETKNRTYIVDEGETIDFATYFNSFSMKKWKHYTTIETLTIKLTLSGTFDIELIALTASSERAIYKAKNIMGAWAYTLDVETPDVENVDVIGLRLTSKTNRGVIIRGEYIATFGSWREQHIGAVICTYKRETYVKRLMETLDAFALSYDWLHVLVVDNGSTLPVGISPSKKIETIHNRNFGGSGGFTRGMIELVELGADDYILLMDDDIVIEPSSIERMRAILCSIRDEYNESFFSGAMLTMEKPTIQWENTSRWFFHPIGLCRNVNITSKSNMCKNENLKPEENRYGGWWFCAIPLKRVKEIGYPLPNFLKCDDIEYGLRNNRKIMSINGVCAWHVAFRDKLSPVNSYFSDRNSLILEHYLHNNAIIFTLHVLLRFIKQFNIHSSSYVVAYYTALCDYSKGYEGITSVGADGKYQEIKKKIKKITSFAMLFKLAIKIISVIKNYKKTRDKYRKFRDEKLQNDKFWKKYLGIE